MRDAGVVKIVAVVKEDIDDEIAEFKKGFWSEEVYVDRSMAFYTALGGGGAPRKPGGACSFLCKALCPCGDGKLKENMANAKQMKVEGNFKGEGFITGGMYVLKADGTPAYAFVEDEYGDKANLDDVIDAIKKAA